MNPVSLLPHLVYFTSAAPLSRGVSRVAGTAGGTISPIRHYFPHNNQSLVPFQSQLNPVITTRF